MRLQTQKKRKKTAGVASTKPLSEKWNRADHGVRREVHDHDANLPNLSSQTTSFSSAAPLTTATTAHTVCNYTPYDQQRAAVHTDDTSKSYHLERGTKQVSTPKIIMKPIAEEWKRCNKGVRLAQHDPNANLSKLGFADESLLAH